MERTFRIPFKKCLKVGLGGAKYVALVLGLVIGIDSLIKGITLDKIQFALILISIASCGTIVFLSPVAFIIMRFYPVKVGAVGITSSTDTGKILRLTWEEMDTISVTSHYGIPYLIINSSINTSVWIPEILDDQENFQNLVLDISQKKNPKFYAFFSALIKTREAHN